MITPARASLVTVVSRSSEENPMCDASWRHTLPPSLARRCCPEPATDLTAAPPSQNHGPVVEQPVRNQAGRAEAVARLRGEDEGRGAERRGHRVLQAQLRHARLRRQPHDLRGTATSQTGSRPAASQLPERRRLCPARLGYRRLGSAVFCAAHMRRVRQRGSTTAGPASARRGSVCLSQCSCCLPLTHTRVLTAHLLSYLLTTHGSGTSRR